MGWILSKPAGDPAPGSGLRPPEPTIPRMIHAMHQGVGPLLAQQALERVTLLLNHVLAAEPEAMARLKPFAGRGIRFVWDGRPTWLPAWIPSPPEARWTVDAAGLLDLATPDALFPDEGGLRVGLDGTALVEWSLAPGGAMVGSAPPMDVQGDATFASALAWLAQNVRWDLEDDLSRVIGDKPARLLAQAGGGFVAGLRTLAATLRRPPK
jgi:ubiquinone biosynthesis protein UbiJ